MIMNCAECKKDFERKRKDKKCINTFCNQSCAAQYNNRKYPNKKKAKERLCKTCGKDARGSNSKIFCKKCIPAESDLNVKYITLEQSTNTNSFKCNGYTGIRGRARTHYKRRKENTKCENCGFAEHIEICHIKSIVDFGKTDLISDINHIQNLLGLCPNCHWMFDNDKLSLETIKSSEFFIYVEK